MNAKNLLTVGLLLFVAAAIFTLVLRQAGDESNGGAAADTSADAGLPTDGLVAYYFHGETRCPTCRNIEAYAQEAIQSRFAEDLASGEIEWRVVNYETPANAHFATDFEIVAPTVVLVRSSQGQQTAWRNLTRVWQLVGDRAAFVDYVQQEAQELLAERQG